MDRDSHTLATVGGELPGRKKANLRHGVQRYAGGDTLGVGHSFLVNYFAILRKAHFYPKFPTFLVEFAVEK